MSEPDHAMKKFWDLDPKKFNYLARFDLRLYHPEDRSGSDWLLELWFCARDKYSGTVYDDDLRRLRLTFYGVDISPLYYGFRIMGTLYLNIESIQDRQLQDLKYEVIDVEGGTLLYCRKFDAQIEIVQWE